MSDSSAREDFTAELCANDGSKPKYKVKALPSSSLVVLTTLTLVTVLRLFRHDGT